MSHFCEFCQMWHTSQSCFHPGRIENNELKELLRKALYQISCTPRSHVAYKGLVDEIERALKG